MKHMPTAPNKFIHNWIMLNRVNRVKEIEKLFISERNERGNKE